MDQFKTKHYAFEREHGSVKITNKDGKSFYVMTSELLEFVASMVRTQQIANVNIRTDAEILGFTR